MNHCRNIPSPAAESLEQSGFRANTIFTCCYMGRSLGRAMQHFFYCVFYWNLYIFFWFMK